MDNIELYLYEKLCRGCMREKDCDRKCDNYLDELDREIGEEQCL